MSAEATRRSRDPGAGPIRDSGQSLAEYGLIIALIGAVCIGALTAFGSTIAGSGGFTSLPGSL